MLDRHSGSTAYHNFNSAKHNHVRQQRKSEYEMNMEIQAFSETEKHPYIEIPIYNLPMNVTLKWLSSAQQSLTSLNMDQGYMAQGFHMTER